MESNEKATYKSPLCMLVQNACIAFFFNFPNRRIRKIIKYSRLFNLKNYRIFKNKQFEILFCFHFTIWKINILQFYKIIEYFGSNNF